MSKRSEKFFENWMEKLNRARKRKPLSHEKSSGVIRKQKGTLINTGKGEDEGVIGLDAALKQMSIYHEACMLFLCNSDFPNEEKSDLAKHLYFLGAVDCVSQLHKLSDIQFAELILEFFQTIGLNEMYARFMVVFFLKMDSVPSAQRCVIEGGEYFNKWINGNTAMPMCLARLLERYCDDLDFPASVGDLYVKVENK